MSSTSENPNSQSLFKRVIKSASWLVLGFGSSQGLRLLSNLLLTRLLFPEAFGLMALVSVVTIGLSLFSDTGVSNAIAQNPRGDEPAFLDTAWTMQIVRGFVLWSVTIYLAAPVAAFYAAPEMALCLPIAGFGLALQGFTQTKVETAYRHLLVGKLTLLNLLAQSLGIVAMAALAYATQSVLALAIGSVLQEAAKLVLTTFLLPGRRNRLRWEKTAGRELFHTGKWIFLSTACFFVTTQGDRAILGKFLTLDGMGLYNIAFFLAGFPVQLAQAVIQRLMIPVYRDKPAIGNPSNRQRHRQLRLALTSAIITTLWIMAWMGPWLINVLYDDRYASAGAIVVLLSASLCPSIIAMTYDRAALAAGDTKSFFVYTASRACFQTTFFLLGLQWFGLLGAIAALGLAVVVSYPLIARLASRYNTWDVAHDMVFALLSLVVCGAAVNHHWALIQATITILQ